MNNFATKEASPAARPALRASDKKLLLCDGMNMLRRVYGANPSPDSPEKAQASVRATLGSFKRALAEHEPTHALAIFDGQGKNWRHELHPQYREGRKPMPAPLREVLPELFEGLMDLGLSVETPTGYEADDGLNAYAVRWARESRGCPCVVLSTDKDLAVLGELDNVRVYNHFSKEWHDNEWALRKMGVPLSLLQDFLALMGDAVDGVPGVSKVGAKTAAALLNEHGSLDAVLAAAATLKGAVGARLREEEGIARLSRKLVSLSETGDGLMRFTWPDLRFRG